MAYDVTSEWDDIHRKLGNYEPLPVEKKQWEYVKENIEKAEELAEEDKLNESGSDLEEDEFMRQYKERRLLEMESREKGKEKLYGYVSEITAEDYVREVNEAGEGVPVVLNFYQDYVPETVVLNRAMESLAEEFPKVKFLRTKATKCVENFPDSSLPYMLHYKDGQLVQTIGKGAFAAYPKISGYSLKHLLSKLKVDGFEDPHYDDHKAKHFVESIRKHREHGEDMSSDEEREDRQYVSNKIFIKY